MTLPLKHIFDKMNGICQMPQQLELLLLKSIVRQEIPKNHVLLEPGQICDYYYYVEKGILSCKRWIKEKEYYMWLMFAGDIATSVDSFNCRVLSEETIRSVTSCTLYLLHWDHAENFRKRYQAFADIRNYLSYEYASHAWNMGVKRPPEELYDYLKELHGEQLLVLPRDMLAAYMGISKPLLYNIIKNDRLKKKRGDK